LRRIVTNQPCRTIHFLHSCGYGREEHGEEVARYVIHFEGGTSEEVPVIIGKDMVVDWLHQATPQHLSGIEHIAWRQPFRKSDGSTGELALSRQTWEIKLENRDKIVTHIDFISAEKLAAPALVAITVE